MRLRPEADYRLMVASGSDPKDRAASAGLYPGLDAPRTISATKHRGLNPGR
jgi:hypothetical protein